jgi:Pectate lyase superfamily protein
MTQTANQYRAVGNMPPQASKFFNQRMACMTICALLASFALQGKVDAAGMRCFDNLPAADAVRRGQGSTLIDAGYIDVTKAPYNANKTGTIDAAPSIQKALTDGYNQSLVVYVPKGTYLVGSPLVVRQIEKFGGCGGSNRKHGNIIVGDGTGGSFPVLKAKTGAFAGKTMITMLSVAPDGVTPGDPGRHYVSLIRGFTIDMGQNSTGNGLSLEGAQLCSIEDIIIKGKFNIGITSLPGSGGSTTNVKVIGGNIGIRQNAYRPTPSIHGVELLNQKKFGIELAGARGGIIVAGFKIEGSGQAGVRVSSKDSASHPQRNLVMADGSFNLSVPAISGSGNAIYLRNVYAKAPTIVANAGIGGLAGNASAWTKVTEYAATDGVPIVVNRQDHSPEYKDGISTVGAPPSKLIGLHAWDPARVPMWFNTQMLDIRDYGATADKHDDDDAPAINSALRDSVTQRKPVYIPRGRFNVRRTIEVPAGAAMIGASYTNSIIYADESWQPTSPTALMRTADAVGNIFLMDFAVNGHEPAPKNNQTANNMYIFHGRTSNMLLRDVQLNRREWWKGQQNKQTVALFSGSAGGRIYNLAFDFHEGGVAIGEHHMFRIEGTANPLAIYQPNTEGAMNDPQVMIKNARNVTWYGFKYENTSGDHELLHIIGSDNIGILGGSGNYTSGKPFVTVNGSNNVTVTALARQGTVTGGNLFEDGVQRVGASKKITTYKKGDAKLFGESNPPGFPYQDH